MEKGQVLAEDEGINMKDERRRRKGTTIPTRHKLRNDLASLNYRI